MAIAQISPPHAWTSGRDLVRDVNGSTGTTCGRREKEPGERERERGQMSAGLRGNECGCWGGGGGLSGRVT